MASSEPRTAGQPSPALQEPDSRRVDDAALEAQQTDEELQPAFASTIRRVTKRIQFKIPIPDRMMLVMTSIATFISIYLIKYSLASYQLAKWTALKEFVVFCRDLQNLNQTNDKCSEALSKPLPPPPGVIEGRNDLMLLKSLKKIKVEKQSDAGSLYPRTKDSIKGETADNPRPPLDRDRNKIGYYNSSGASQYNNYAGPGRIASSVGHFHKAPITESDKASKPPASNPTATPTTPYRARIFGHKSQITRAPSSSSGILVLDGGFGRVREKIASRNSTLRFMKGGPFTEGHLMMGGLKDVFPQSSYNPETTGRTTMLTYAGCKDFCSEFTLSTSSRSIWGVEIPFTTSTRTMTMGWYGGTQSHYPWDVEDCISIFSFVAPLLIFLLFAYKPLLSGMGRRNEAGKYAGKVAAARKEKKA